MELQRMGDAPAQQGAATAAPGPQQDDDQRRAALQMSGEDAWRRRGMAAPADDGWGPGGLGSSGGGLGSGGAGLGMGGAAAPPPSSSGQPKGMSLAQASADLELQGLWEGHSLCSACPCKVGTALVQTAHLPLPCCLLCSPAEAAGEDGLEGGRGPGPQPAGHGHTADDAGGWVPLVGVQAGQKGGELIGAGA